MTPEALVQTQLDAYNAHDPQAFIACYSDDILVYRPPATGQQGGGPRAHCRPG